MSSLKRKLNKSAPSSTLKPTKKQKLPPAPQKLPKSEEIVVDSTDDEPAQTEVRTKSTITASEGRSNGKKTTKKSKKRSPEAKASREAAKFADDFMSLPRDERNYAELISISSMSESSADDKTESDHDDNAGVRKEANRETPQAQNSADEETDSSTDGVGLDQIGRESESEKSVEERPIQTAEARSCPTPQEPPLPYDPPPGFQAATFTSSTKVQKLFTKEKLHDKQVWYITAPASIPIGSIKEVPIQKVTSGASIMSHQNADYGLITEADTNSTEKVLLIPSSEGNVYIQSGAKIEKTLNLQQIVGLPSTAKSSEASLNGVSSVPKSHIKSVRRQPEGLKMRYRPFGDESPSEDSDSSPLFKKPPITTLALSSKNFRPVENDKEASPAKKLSKRNSAKAIHADVATSSPRSKSKPETLQLELQNGIPAKEAPEQKAKRRAEKKRRREQIASSSDKLVEADEIPTMSLSGKEHEGNDKMIVYVNDTTEKSKTKKDRGAGGTSNPLDAGSPQRSLERQVAPSTTLEDARLGQAEPEKAKPKKKKRKSEATEEA
ncbi:MAG: hypothetical protein LQ345_006635 [Seirophora villosa]|nr:MAG: hypothetical protein LQ345_006635 [Seirophora villosa]